MDRRQLLEAAVGLPLAAPLLGAAGKAPGAGGEAVRLAVLDAQARFCWGLDSGDAAFAAGAFAPGATVQDMEGKVWDKKAGGPLAYAHAAITDMGGGGETFLQLNDVAAHPRGYLAKFYWSRVTWAAEDPAPGLAWLGSFTDLFVRDGQSLRIARKVIGRWDSSTVKVANL